MSSHRVILSPRSKERALYMLDDNKLEFYVSRTSTKPDIRHAMQELFQVEALKVNTRITKEGKLAIVTLTADHSAEDLSNLVELVGGRERWTTSSLRLNWAIRRSSRASGSTAFRWRAPWRVT